MATEKTLTAVAVASEMLHVGSYKRNQGRVVRLVTAVTLGVVFALVAWRLRETLAVSANATLSSLQWVLSGAMLAIGWWFSYRLVNLPQFADFLIAVEAEMSKVSWPTQTELIRSSVVVIFFILSLAAILFAFDLFWQWVFKNVLGVM